MSQPASKKPTKHIISSLQLAQLRKAAYYSSEIAKWINKLSMEEAKDINRMLSDKSLEFDEAIEKLGKFPFAARLKLLLERLVANTCCGAHLGIHLLAGCVSVQIEALASKPTLH